MKLTYTFRDAQGHFVVMKTAPLAQALADIAEFVTLHGTDPDEDGAAAQRGSVEFEPAHDPHCTCNDCMAEFYFRQSQ